ncbi:MAG: HPr family phosphocarrier protein [Spirochaetaceae bacterium]|jgi:phosphocarrier protein|nr:HPr family phosphocarrier protein [Spirochaetaceae bacterium]
MIEQEVQVKNRAGIHARPASLIVAAINKMESQILFEVGSRQIDAKSILGVITLGAAYGTKIKIIASGTDEKEAVNTIVHLFETKFEEEGEETGESGSAQ